MAGQLGSYKIAISPDLASFKTVSRTVGSSLRGAQQQIDRSMNFSGVSAAASKAVTATLSQAPKIGSAFSAAGGVAAKGLSAIGGALEAAGSTAASIASSIGNVFAAAGKTAAGAMAAAVGALSTQIPDALQSSDMLQGYDTALSAAGFDSSTIKATKKQLRDFADQTEYDLNDVMNVSATLASNGVQDFTTLTKALGGFVSTFNLADPAQGFQQLSFVTQQIAAAGKVMTGDWYQVQNAAPAAAGVLKKALTDMGAYTGDFKDALSSGQISADEFFKAIEQIGLTDAAQKAATSVDTFSGAIGNLKASVQEKWVDLFDPIKPAITGFISGPLTNAANKAMDAISGALGKIEPLLVDSEGNFKSFRDVVKGVFDSIGQINANAVVQKIAGSFSGLISKITPVLQQIVPRITGFITSIDWGSVAGTVYSSITSVFTSIDWGRLFYGITKAFSDVISTIIPMAEKFIDSLDFGKIFTTLLTNIRKLITSVDWVGLARSIAGAIGEALSTITSFIQSIDWRGVVSTIYSTITSFFTSIDWGGLFDGIADAFSDVVSTIVPMAERFIDSLDFGKILTTLVTSVTKLISSVDWVGLAQSIADALGEALSAIPRIFSIAAGQFGLPDASAVANAISEAIGSALDLGSWLLQKLGDGLSFVAQHLGDIAEVLIAIPNGVLDWVDKQFTGDGLLNLLSSLGAWVQSIASSIGKQGDKVGEAVGSFFGKVVDLAIDAIVTIITNPDKVLSFVGKVVTAIFNGVTSFIQGFIGGWLDGEVSNISNGLMDRVKDIKAGLGRVWQQIKDWFMGKLHTIPDMVGSVVNDVKKAGENLLKGLKEGIQNGWSNIKNSVTNVANKVSGRFHDVWKEHSPSRVFMEIGGHLMTGLQIGIEDGARSVFRAADRLGTRLTDSLSLQPEVTFSTAGTQQQLQSLAQARLHAVMPVQPVEATAPRAPQITINQEISKMDDLAQLYSVTKRAATGYFARALA